MIMCIYKCLGISVKSCLSCTVDVTLATYLYALFVALQNLHTTIVCSDYKCTFTVTVYCTNKI